jgi:hypothetical protein
LFTERKKLREGKKIYVITHFFCRTGSFQSILINTVKEQLLITENQTFSAEITLLLLFDKAEMTVMVFCNFTVEA